MFKIHKKKIRKSVFLPDGIPKLSITNDPGTYKLTYRSFGEGDIRAEVFFTESKVVQYYTYTGEYWKFLNKHTLIDIK